MTIMQTYPTTATTSSRGDTRGVAVRPEVAIAHLIGKTAKHQLKCFTVVQDGDVWRWRCSWPQVPGKLAMVSTMAYEDRTAAEQAAQHIAHIERPSICMVGAWQNVPTDAGQPAEYREGYIGA